MPLELSKVIPWGRLFREYELMFGLTPADLRGRILGCGDGPASFNTEGTARGAQIVSVDPLYAFSAAEIRRRFAESAVVVMDQVLARPGDWVWSFHKKPQDLRANRERALNLFLADYEAGLREGRYIAGELPQLPFAGESFDLALCSHLLFLYSPMLSEEVHVRSLLELCRVAREVRIFPLLTLDSKPSSHLEIVRRTAHQAGWSTEIVKVSYELQPGGNEMLRIFR